MSLLLLLLLLEPRLPERFKSDECTFEACRHVTVPSLHPIYYNSTENEKNRVWAPSGELLSKRDGKIYSIEAINENNFILFPITLRFRSSLFLCKLPWIVLLLFPNWMLSVCTKGFTQVKRKGVGDGAQMFQSKLGISAKTLKTIE